MQRSDSPLFKKFLTVLSLIGLCHGQAHASELGQESIALDPIARAHILSNNGKEALFSEKGISTKDSKSVGLDVVVSENINLYSIPLAYGKPMRVFGGDEYLNLTVDIPYFNFESTPDSESGLGDIALAAEYFIEKDGSILKAEFNLKVPSGDEKIGLGSGSTDVGFALTGRKRVGEIGFNTSSGYIIRGEATINNADINYGNVFNIAGGAEYQLVKHLWLGANVAYVHTGTSEFSGGAETDGLQTLDVIPNIAYHINTDMAVTADLIYPIQEHVIDGDFPSSAPDRKISFSLGFHTEF